MCVVITACAQNKFDFSLTQRVEGVIACRKKQHVRFDNSGAVLQLTRDREEEVSRCREGKGRTNVRLLLHHTGWNLSLRDSARVAARSRDFSFVIVLFFLHSMIRSVLTSHNNGLRHRGDCRGVYGERVGAVGMSPVNSLFQSFETIDNCHVKWSACAHFGVDGKRTLSHF